MSNIPPTQGLYEFVTVVEAGSVSAAARALELPRATLSRRISALEHDCGVRLLHRTTRKLTLTEAGDALYKRAPHHRRRARGVDDGASPRRHPTRPVAHLHPAHARPRPARPIAHQIHALVP